MHMHTHAYTRAHVQIMGSRDLHEDTQLPPEQMIQYFKTAPREHPAPHSSLNTRGSRWEL